MPRRISIGCSRPGDNLFTASIVALDVKTGKYKWHFQQVHHDIWDYDAPNPVMLFDAKVDGKMRKGLAQASKTGWLYILDRETGKPLIGIDEKPVPQEPRQATAATQPYPVGDAFVPQSKSTWISRNTISSMMAGSSRRYCDKPVPIKPSLAGGANWPPSSYDPETHTAYVCASQQTQLFHTREAGRRAGNGAAKGLRHFRRDGLTTNKIVWRRSGPSSVTAAAP